MEDGTSAAFYSFDSFYGNPREFDLMDDLLDNGYLIEIAQRSESDFPSSSGLNNLPSYYLPAPESNCPNLNPDTSQERETNLDESEKSQLAVAKRDEFPGNRFPDEVFDPTPWSLGGTEAFPAAQTVANRLIWAIPPAGPSLVSSVMRRLTQAIEYLRESMKNRDALIQIWVPVRSGGEEVLTTENQP